MDSYLKQTNPKWRLNLYRLAYDSIRGIMKWDFSAKGRQSKKTFAKMQNKYAGKKAIILCNGPSLNKVDFEMLKDSDVFTIGLNKINLLFSKTEFRPNLVVAINKLVIDQNKDFFSTTDIDVILNNGCADLFPVKPNINYVYSLPYQLRFAGDITGAVCQGYTVTYVALQIAFHLGFSEVTLVGCDHYFETKGSPNMKVKAGKADSNHFSADYFSNGVEWQLPDLMGSEMHYKLADEFYKANNRIVYNSTEGGELEIFERKPLNEFLNG